jgi:hypothetical protein
MSLPHQLSNKTIPLDDTEGWQVEGTAFADLAWQSYQDSFETLGLSGFTAWCEACQDYLDGTVAEMRNAKLTPESIAAFCSAHATKLSTYMAPYLVGKLESE